MADVTENESAIALGYIGLLAALVVDEASRVLAVLVLIGSVLLIAGGASGSFPERDDDG